MLKADFRPVSLGFGLINYIQCHHLLYQSGEVGFLCSKAQSKAYRGQDAGLECNAQTLMPSLPNFDDTTLGKQYLRKNSGLDYVFIQVAFDNSS